MEPIVRADDRRPPWTNGVVVLVIGADPATGVPIKLISRDVFIVAA